MRAQAAKAPYVVWKERFGSDQTTTDHQTPPTSGSNDNNVTLSQPSTLAPIAKKVVAQVLAPKQFQVCIPIVIIIKSKNFPDTQIIFQTLT
jgi:hypothetical protein